jgi:hypothetical protein
LRRLLGLPLVPPLLALCGYGWLNIGYPIRLLLGDSDYHDAWAGPTYGGVWAFHALLGGVPMVFALPWLLRGCTALLVRILER